MAEKSAKEGQKSLDPVEKLLDSALSASKRSRYLFGGLVIFTLVLLTQLFNSWRFSWTAERLRTYAFARALVACAGPPESVRRPSPAAAEPKEESWVVIPFEEASFGGCG